MVCNGLTGLTLTTLAAIAPDQETLIVAESMARRLIEFTIDDEGTLGDRRVFAAGLDGPPDGIALDVEGGVWRR